MAAVAGGGDPPRIALGSVGADRRPAAEHRSGAGRRRVDRRGAADAARRDRADRRHPLDRRVSPPRRRQPARPFLDTSAPSRRYESISPTPDSPIPFLNESRRRRARRSGTQRPHAVPRARAGGQRRRCRSRRATRARRCRARSPTSRGSACIASPRRRCGSAPSVTGSSYAARRPARRRRVSASACGGRCGRCRRPDLVLVQNPPAFPTLAVTWFSLRRRGVRFVIDWHNLGYTLLQLRLGRLASGGAAGALVRAPRCAGASTRNLCVSRGLAAFLESRFGVQATRSVLYDRPASAFVADRRAPSANASARRCSRGSASAPATVGFIVCPTSWTEDEDFDVVIEAVMHLEERIRGWEAGERVPAVSRSGDSRHRRRRAPRRVRAAVRRPAGAADPAARALARARRLSARRRQRRSRPVPAPLLVGPRHPDEGRRSVRRRRAGAARSTTAPASPSACATATTACCSRPRRQLADVLFDLFETFPADQSALDRLRKGAHRWRGRRGKKAGPPRRGRCCCPTFRSGE